MNLTAHTSFKKMYYVGIALNVVSFLFYLFFSKVGDFAFAFNYMCCVVYLLVLFVTKTTQAKPRPSIPYECWLNYVVLLTISAFALNKQMGVFAPLPLWMNIVMLLLTALFFTLPYINALPKLAQFIVNVLVGAAIVFALYMTIYLLPIVPISLAIFIFLGLSVHTFVPLIWLVVLVHYLIVKTPKSGSLHAAWAVGVILPLLMLGVYLNKWNSIQHQIKDIVAQQNIQLTNKLPIAVALAQKLPNDNLTEKIILSPYKSQRFWNNNLSMGDDGEKKFHDPLSIIALELLGEIDVSKETAETFLNIRKDYRHHTTDKLWTGTNLSTSSVATNISIYPNYRLAYHEKTIVIHHTIIKDEQNFWFTADTQEALYTFHAPEGSIVTSLSLWINGVEQKSRLTTKQKADSAYTTIVGTERRDPAIVHWQEGNRISVNIFPCTATEDRTFKIGFTTPLAYHNNTLELENVWFEGPNTNNTNEITSISFAGNATNFINLPSSFETDIRGNFTYKGNYTPYWKIAMQALPLSTNKFTFNGFDYSIKNIETTDVAQDIKYVYLDVTNTWNKADYDTIIDNCTTKEIYTWLPEKIKITPQNKNKVWDIIKENQFSMPFLQDIHHPSNTLIITNASAQSPILADMKNSDYAVATSNYLTHATSNVRLINIGEELAPIWKSLLELRLINYTTCTNKNVINLINGNKITDNKEDSLTINLHHSNIAVVKTITSKTKANSNNAPDHLLRIFAYNDVLRKIGKHYFESAKYENQLFTQAEEAYVVTPVTGMIVLESEADYKRMGIDKNKNTIGNASVIGGGAVPEPHEWLLILFVLGIVVWQVYFKNKFQAKLS